MRLLEIAMAWFAYFALHSLLAASPVKAWVGRRWPHLMPGYRAAFNCIAVGTLVPVLWLVYGTGGDWLWQWKGGLAWLANGLALIALLCFFASTHAYDMGEFLGLRQLREHGNDDIQTFTLSIFHRFVRHPWYCFSLILIWTRDMNRPLLVSAVAISLYFVVGSKLEERKLVARYGEKYRRYMAKVPGLIPLPWKYLTSREADTLVNSQDSR
jgi:protein-S-isoprenylcysteine O-methyltransferase Ste14